MESPLAPPQLRVEIYVAMGICYQYIIGKEEEYPTSLWYCVTTCFQICDLCNNIHILEVHGLLLVGMLPSPSPSPSLYGIYNTLTVHVTTAANRFSGINLEPLCL